MSATTSLPARSPAAQADAIEVAQAASIKSVYVYEAPVRPWHWVNVLAITVLGVSGYLIGLPLPSMPGEASDHFLMGYIRFAHFAAGYVLAIGLLGRLYWAIVGNHHARDFIHLDGQGANARVRLCGVHAPTEWNFHPHGAVAEFLETLPSPIEPTIQALMTAFDPCVSFELLP